MERRDGGLMMIREQGNGMEMDVDVDVEKREWNPEIDGYWDAVDAILLGKLQPGRSIYDFRFQKT